MGKKPTKKYKPTDSDYLDAYEILGTARAVADHFQISTRTARRHLKRLGVVLIPGRHAGDSAILPHWGCLPMFLRTHPGTILPRSVRAICEMTGCSQDAVKTYLWRRRDMVRKLAQKVVLTGTFKFEDHTYPWRAAKELEIFVDPYSFETHITGIIPATGRTFAISYKESVLRSIGKLRE